MEASGAVLTAEAASGSWAPRLNLLAMASPTY